jgi:hypothetical protein
MSNLRAGIYTARPTGESSVYENDKGNLILCMEMTVEGELARYYCALATQRDGINIRTVETLKNLFPWDGTDFFWFVDHPEAYKDIEVEAEVEMRPGRDGDRFFPSIKYLNDRQRHGLPEPGKRQALLDKYGAKFRAVSGGTTPRRPPPQAAATPAAPASKTDAKTADRLSVWKRYCELGGNEEGWFETLKQAVPDVDPEQLTPQQWAQALEWIETYTFPM